MQHSTDESLFLATTALEAYWDKSKPLLFLGPWCLRFSLQETYQSLSYQVLPDQWQDKTVRVNAQIYIEDLHALFLKALASKLNDIHQANHSLRFWEILLGPWLRVYLTVLYDRFSSLEKVYAFFPHLTTIGLPAEDYQIPTNNGDFAALLATDEYNLQIYTQILVYLGLPFERKSLQKNHDAAVSQVSAKDKIKNKIRQYANKLFLSLGRKEGILLAESGISLSILLRFFLQSYGMIVPLTYLEKIDSVADNKKRAALKEMMIGRSHFENCALHLIAAYLPTAYLEGYEALTKWAKQFHLKPAAIFSAMGWHYNEGFKYLAAHFSEEKSLLCGHQHGGDYGILSYHIAELHETSVTDQFYTWGWEAAEKRAKYRPLSGLKLRKKKSLAQASSPILYGCANSYRYLRRFSFSVDKQLQYYALQREFILNLTPPLLDHLVIRLYPMDWGWERKARWQAISPKLHFQSSGLPFAKALQSSQIYIVDHISTTFAESMAANHPTLLFCDPEMWEVREEAKPYFAELKAAGLYFDNPQEAAQHLNQISPYIKEWWQMPERQKAIHHFSSRFCQPASANLKEWRQMFQRLHKEAMALRG